MKCVNEKELCARLTVLLAVEKQPELRSKGKIQRSVNVVEVFLHGSSSKTAFLLIT